MDFELDEQFCKISELVLQVDKIITEAEEAGILNDENGFSFSEKRIVLLPFLSSYLS